MKTLALVALPLLATAQEEQEIERLTAWPELEAEVEDRVELDVTRLRKARTPDMRLQAIEGLENVGAGAAPDLLEALVKEKDEEVRADIVSVLTNITGAPHTRLLAREFGSKSPDVRRFALRRTALFPDPGTRAAAEAALASAREPGRRHEPDPEEVLAAGLAATASGSLAALDVLQERARKAWSQDGPLLRTVLAAVKGDEATGALLPRLGDEGRDVRLATLRMLGACGTKASVEPCAKFLDEEDIELRTAAINALRGIVDGKPPLERLSAFDAIERAQEWKRRVR